MSDLLLSMLLTAAERNELLQELAKAGLEWAGLTPLHKDASASCEPKPKSKVKLNPIFGPTHD